MRIKYAILWVEDDNNWYEDTKGLLEDTLEETGFIMDCTRIEGVDELKSLIEQDGLQKFDLVLVDFKLGENDTKFGDKVIGLIRDKNIYTDIIFYSSQLSAVHQKIQENKIEGVYSSNREHIEDKFDDIFNKTIKKIQEVNTMRGLLMAETSDLDELMVDIIQIALQRDFGNTLSDYIIKEMKNTINKNSSAIEGEAKISEKIKDSRIFTSFHKAKAINKIYKLHPELSDDKFFENYNKDVLKTRNIFGHVKEENGKLVSTLTGAEETFTEEGCIEIRKNLIKHRNKLEALQKAVSDEENSQGHNQ